MKKSCTISIIGQPNSGKSSFLNYIMKSKLVAVSRKKNTTIQNVWGTFIFENTEFLIIDTPGWRGGSKEYRINSQSASATHQAELTIVLIDSAKAKLDFLDLELTQMHEKVIPVLSKHDIAVNLAEKLCILCNKNVFCISVKTGYGIAELFRYLQTYAVERDWIEVKTSATLFEIAAERTREYIFKYLHQEVPYCLKVRTISCEEKNGEYFIKQNILVPNKRYSHIIIGKKGAQLKQIGTLTRLDLQTLWGKRVHLNIQVTT